MNSSSETLIKIGTLKSQENETGAENLWHHIWRMNHGLAWGLPGGKACAPGIPTGFQCGSWLLYFGINNLLMGWDTTKCAQVPGFLHPSGRPGGGFWLGSALVCVATWWDLRGQKIHLSQPSPPSLLPKTGLSNKQIIFFKINTNYFLKCKLREWQGTE